MIPLVRVPGERVPPRCRRSSSSRHPPPASPSRGLYRDHLGNAGSNAAHHRRHVGHARRRKNHLHRVSGRLLTKMNASRRVLVVDLDLRQARLADAFEIKDRRGTIDEFLLGTKTLEECVHVDAASGVHFICARSNTPNAPDVLESDAMKNALANFCERYDLVILDSPPVMAVSDARIISRLADYTIFLVYWAATQREVVTNAVNLLRTVSERVGIVINKVDLAKHVRYGYGDYGYYYSRYRSYYGMDGKKKSRSSARGKSKQPSV